MNNTDRRIRITFETYTPESIELGDAEDRGWVNEDGVSMEPDDYDLEDGIGAVDKAIAFLRDKGAWEASSSHWDSHCDIWYTQSDPNINYGTGEEYRESYHLAGFSEEEERQIFLAMTKR